MNRLFRSWMVVCFAGAGLLLACPACNRTNSQSPIAGEVTLDGKPLEEGVIRFLPIDGAQGSIAAGEVRGGRFQIAGRAGPTIGWNRVEINGFRRTGRMIPAPFPQQGMIEERIEAVPPQFNAESTLKYEVKPGSNTADFELSSS